MTHWCTISRRQVINWNQFKYTSLRSSCWCNIGYVLTLKYHMNILLHWYIYFFFLPIYLKFKVLKFINFDIEFMLMMFDNFFSLDYTNVCYL